VLDLPLPPADRTMMVRAWVEAGDGTARSASGTL